MIRDPDAYRALDDILGEEAPHVNQAVTLEEVRRNFPGLIAE